MNKTSFAVTIFAFNAVLLAGVLLSGAAPANASQQALTVLRGRGLEIVDAENRLRASVTLQPATTVNGVRYPEEILLRLIDANGKPVVKMSGGSNGTGLLLNDGSDAAGIQLIARDTASLIRVTNRSGRVQVVRP